MTGETPVLTLLRTVFEAILEVFLICLAGWVLAWLDILDRRTQKQINRINVSLFTPCLIFSKVAFQLSPAKLKELWIIPLFFVGVTAVSAAVAWLMATLSRLKRTQRNFAIAAAMFNNSNSLPIALMQSLVVTVKGLKWGDDDTKDQMMGRALGYFVLWSTLGMALRWSFGVHLLSKADDEVTLDADANPEQDTLLARNLEEGGPSPLIGESGVNDYPNITGKDDDVGITVENSPSTASSSAASSPPNPFLQVAAVPPPRIKPRRKNTGRHGQPVQVFYSFPNTAANSGVALSHSSASPPLSSDDEDGAQTDSEWGSHHHVTVTPPTRTRLQSALRQTRNILRKINNFMTIPMYAAITSLIVACVPALQHTLDSHVKPFKGALSAAGSCSIPLTILVLGAYFYTPKEVEEEAEVVRRRPGRTGSETSTSVVGSIRNAFRLRNYRRNATPKKEKDARPGETRTVWVAVLARMVVTPMIVLPGFVALAFYDIIRVFDDPVFMLSCILLITSPPALTLAQITQAASGDAFERLISRTIFLSYCVLTPPLTIAYVVFGLEVSYLT